MSNTPQTCQAVVIRQHGGPEVLEVAEVAVPKPRANEVLLRVKATSINHLDIWVRRGLPHIEHIYPHVMGADCAGEVVAVGDDVDGVAQGTPVVVSPGRSCGACQRCLSGWDNLCRNYGIGGENRPGVMAEYVAVPRRNLLPFPAGSSWAEAAAIPLTFLTAWQMIAERARVQPGETVLIHAAGSGVSVAAIQIARLFGATVLATASTDEKLTLATELGADHTINYTAGFAKDVKNLTDRRGVDVVIDHVGEATWEESIRSLTWGGRLVTCGASSGFCPTIDLRHVFFRQLQILGSTMGSMGSLFTILEHIESGALRAVIDRTFAMSAIADAHRHVEQRQQFGKVVVVPDNTDAEQRPPAVSTP